MNLRRRFNVVSNAISKGIFPHQLWWALELPWRRVIFSQARLVHHLELRPNLVVLELGAGSGYYSRHVATQMRGGQLLLSDLQVEMLARNRSRFVSKPSAKVIFVAADATSLPLVSASVDLVFMVTVFGEVPNQAACLAEVARVLRPGGELSISEHLPDPDFYRFATLNERLDRAGFVLIRRQGPGWAYTATFGVRRGPG